MDNKLLKTLIFLITYAVLLVAVIVNLDFVFSLVATVFTILSPILVGFCTAFVLNGPYLSCRTLYGRVFKGKRTKKLVKPLSLITIYILFLLLIALFVLMVIPQITSTITNMIDNIENYVANAQNTITKFFEYFHLENFLFFDLTDLESYLTSFLDFLGNSIMGWLPHIFDMTKNIATFITNALLGFILSIYMLASRERLLRQIKALSFAYIPKKIVEKLYDTTLFTSQVFNSFISGRLLDAFIIGILCFIGMSIFRFEHAVLISVVVGVTNIIPIFGPFIGGTVGAILLLITNPIQMLWFILFIVVLQQIDGNFIGPKIVGDSMGIPAMWVMIAVIVGGGLFGVLGMLIGVPFFAVIYLLAQKAIRARIAKNN